MISEKDHLFKCQAGSMAAVMDLHRKVNSEIFQVISSFRALKRRLLSISGFILKFCGLSVDRPLYQIIF